MKPLTLQNYTELQPYIQLANYNEYNSNIITMLMWNSRYTTYFETYDTYALVSTKMPNHEPIWLMPYTTIEHRLEAVEKIRELSTTQHRCFELHSMTKEFKDWLQQTYPNEFLFWDCYDARDYVYDRQQQESLAGKKMQKRRNHFHAFEKQYEGRFIYQEMTEKQRDDVYAFLRTWKQCKEEEDSLDAEEEGIHFLLDHMDQLPLQGGCLYIDGTLEAFNITSFLSNDTVQIHVEKANKNIRGCYIAILKLFLETLPSNITFVNREDDMGKSELRKAKTDMQPICKINKFGCSYEPLHIHQATQTQRDDIEQLWLTSFKEENEESTTYFFDHLYQEKDTYVLSSQDCLLSMAQARPFSLSLQGNLLEVPFLFGVATQEEYQGVGYMRTLIDHILSQSESPYLFVQAYNWDIYRSLGFQEAYYLAKTKLRKEAYTNVAGAFVNGDATTLLELYKSFTLTQDGYRIRDLAYYDQMRGYHAIWHTTYQVFLLDGQPQGYLLLEEQETTLLVRELIYSNQTALEAMLSLLSTNEKAIVVYSDVSTELIGRRKEELSMMVYCKDNKTYPIEQGFLQEEV